MKRDAIIIATGTAAAAVVFEFERKRAALIRRLGSRVATTSDAEAAMLKERIAEIRSSIQTLALDVDGRSTYELNAPLDETEDTWPIGTFLACPLPRADLSERIRDGRYPGRYEHLNPAALAALAGHANASGALRPNGWLAVEANRSQIEQRIENLFQAIVGQRRTFSRGEDSTLSVIVVAGSFGGFGSGSVQWLQSVTDRIAREKQLDLRITTFLMLPGNHAPKDPETTGGVTFGLLTELIARSTGIKRDYGPDGSE